ncbi:Uncharacterised protein [Mycobacteroides abscessus subsp. abscessus]|nr:Uncharacterised protein [Mycobacteroides abscessus subsp. abscessus]
MKRSAARFDNAGFEALYVAMHANKAYGESQTLADDIGAFLAYAAAPPEGGYQSQDQCGDAPGHQRAE